MKKFSKINESSKQFKISLDFHGVVDAMPEFFGFFTRSMISCGCEIHIVTGGLTKENVEMLKKYDIKYTKIFSIVEYHKSKGTPTFGKHPKYGFDMIADEEWDRSKGDYCRENGIDLHIDDTLAYNGLFSTPFARLWTHNNFPKSDKDSKYLD